MASIPTTVVRIQGRAVADTQPQPGEALLWNQAQNRWQPGSAEVSGAGVQIGSSQPTSPARGDMWLNTNNNTLSVYDGTNWLPAGAGGVTISTTAPTSPYTGQLWFNPTGNIFNIWNGSWQLAAVPEAPPNPNSVYGRSGVTPGSWQTVVPLAPAPPGVTMLGTLILNGPPHAGTSPLNQAATMGYVDDLITGALSFIGTYNASVTPNTVSYTETSGISSTTLINPAQAKDSYLIVSHAGTGNFAAPVQPWQQPLVGEPLFTTEWIISDGTRWYPIQHDEMHMLASDIALDPHLWQQDNVQGALEYIAEEGVQARAEVGPGQPSNPNPGQLWFNGTDLFVFYNNNWWPALTITFTGDVQRTP